MKIFILPLWGAAISASWFIMSSFEKGTPLVFLFAALSVFSLGGIIIYWVVTVSRHPEDFKIKW